MNDQFQIRSCSDSLLTPGQCCICHQRASIAALTKDLVEHARCERHATGDHLLATKPLIWDPAWGPR